jgi:hypothetical protein
MAKGGARTRSGPAPDPNALARERDEGEWKVLPSVGREGPTPDWPLTRALKRELTLWAELWTRPQAVMWERQRQNYEVALYVRRLCEAEARDSAVNLSTLVRQMADSLGLTTPGLRSNRWRIESDQPQAASNSGPARQSARERLRLVADAGA